MMTATIRRCAALFFGFFAVAACSDSSGTGTGLLTVRLTDAPFPFSDVARVDVYVVRVDAKAASTTDAEHPDQPGRPRRRQDDESRSDHARDGKLSEFPPHCGHG
jgi:hypothetical protein